MFWNLTALRTELRSRLKSNSAILSDDRLNFWLNGAQDDIANEMDFQHLVSSVTVDTIAGVRQYYAPLIANKKIRSISNVNQDQPIDEYSKTSLINRDPNESDVGTPYCYAAEGMGYIRNSHGLGTANIVSFSGSDTSQKVRIQGRTNEFVNKTELLTLNGGTTVTGTVIWDQIYSVTKNTTTTGQVEVSVNDTAGTIIAEISPNLLVDETAPFYVYPTPTATETLLIHGYRRPYPMINDEDFPDLPTGYHELVLIGGEIRGHKDLFRDNKAKELMAMEFTPRLVQLRKEQNKRSVFSTKIIGMYKKLPVTGTNLPPTYGE